MQKILIVDDEPNIVMPLEYAFKKKDFQVFIARDGQEALEIAEQEIPDVVLLDIMMPLVDGYETLAAIRSNTALDQTKVVFVSAKNKASDIEKGMALGAASYITKPFSVKKVLAEIQELLA